ncbi:MAG: CpaF/VirB11 family protein [Bacteriovoracales bacterium]|nr:CpaF/VirB11 family protein [Bacteriovoracales bacterium]
MIRRAFLEREGGKGNGNGNGDEGGEEERKKIFLQALKQGEIVHIEDDWFGQTFGLGFLKDYLKIEGLEEIIIHHPRQSEIVTSFEQKLTDMDLDEGLWNWVVSYLCLKEGIPFNLGRPFASFMLPFSKVNIRGSFIHQEALPTPFHKAFFRILPASFFPLEDFSKRDVGFLLEAVDQKKNILVSGATGSGKTSLLKTLFHHCAKKRHHIITVEDTHELQHDFPWVTSLIAKEHPQYAMEQYLTYAMRMRPERIVLGEIRSKEIVPLLLALNCGHGGLLSTVHANSAQEALHRLALLFQLYGPSTLSHEVTMSLLCQNIDITIHIEARQIAQVIHVLGHDKGRPIFDDLLSPAQDQAKTPVTPLFM